MNIKKLVVLTVDALLGGSGLGLTAAHASAKADPSLEQRVADLEAYLNNVGRGADAADAKVTSKVGGAGPGHNGWMMTSSALVLFMTLPGLALFYGGLVRRKNVLSVLAQCLGIAGLVTILWWLCGYSLVFSDVGRTGGDRSTFLAGLQHLFLNGVDGDPACFDGNSGPGAALALEKAGKGLDVRLASVDLEPPQLELLRRGLIDVAFIQKREAFTYRAFQMLYTYQHGSPTMGNLPGPINIPGNIDTGYVIVTKENADTFETELSLDQVFESHELSQRLALVTSMVENSPEAALATDVNGRIVYANPSSVRKLGFDERKLLQINFETVFQITAQQRAEIALSMAEGGSYRLETLARSR